MTSGKKSARKLDRASQLQKELEAERLKSEDCLSRLKYLQADFENYRKRVEKNSLDASQRANERLIVDLLGVIDDLERTMETVKTTDNMDSLLEGVEMTYKNLRTVLEREGLATIESLGKPFDPNLHEVLIQVPVDDREEGMVVEEVRKGFMLRGKVIRPSVVKISSKSGESVEK